MMKHGSEYRRFTQKVMNNNDREYDGVKSPTDLDELEPSDLVADAEHTLDPEADWQNDYQDSESEEDWETNYSNEPYDLDENLDALELLDREPESGRRDLKQEGELWGAKAATPYEEE